MGISQTKRSRHSAQPRAPHSASTKTLNTASAPTPKPNKKATPTKKRRRRRELPLLPPPVITRRGKTTIRRYTNHSFHRMEEVKGKIVDYVEFHTSGESHDIDITFQDKTALHFSIDPGFLLETEYADWKTGNRRLLKRWPVLRSRGLSNPSA
jgi:hypothetical protein